MPKICYSTAALTRLQKNPVRLAAVHHASTIITSHQKQGFDLTLRQIYYKFVAKDLFPDDMTWVQVPGSNKWVKHPQGTKNAEPNYKWLGAIVTDARMAGLMDWEAIVDRTRYLRDLSHWDSPAAIVKGTAAEFRVAKWKTQPYHLEVWIEKDALVGVIAGVCNRWDLPYFSCRGYTSVSGMWGAAQRLQGAIDRGKVALILHLGDHDPSGVDMTRDIKARIREFGVPIKVKRLALTFDQVQQYQPPPNPAKVVDPRAKAYIAKYGHLSWELDALEPAVLAALIERAVTLRLDQGAWDVATLEQKAGRRLLKRVSGQWTSVVGMLEEGE